MSPGARLRALVSAPDVLVLPGATSALTARVLEQTGFPAVYATGAGIVNDSRALPDLGLLGMSEVAEHVRWISEAVGVPVLADADTGFGGPLNVARTVREFERAGAAGIQIEDQQAPKRCGHFDGRSVVDETEMVGRVRAALAARDDSSTVVVARTDAAGVLGFEEALRRGRLLADAGADIVFVESPSTVEELERIPKEVGAPTLVNVVEGGRTPQLSAAEYQDMGFAVALFANTAMRLAVHAVRRGMAELQRTGSSAGLAASMVSWEDRQSLVRTQAHDDLAAQLVAARGDTVGGPPGFPRERN